MGVEIDRGVCRERESETERYIEVASSGIVKGKVHKNNRQENVSKNARTGVD
jgi:hypothetical protein